MKEGQAEAPPVRDRWQEPDRLLKAGDLNLLPSPIWWAGNAETCPRATRPAPWQGFRVFSRSAAACTWQLQGGAALPGTSSYP